MSSFKKAFADARAAQKKKTGSGAGGTFKWNGKSYSTNYAEEEKKTAPTSSPRPRSDPRQGPPAPKTNAPKSSPRPRARSSVSAVGSSPRPMPTGAVTRNKDMSFHRPEVIDRRATKVLATAAPRVAATPVQGTDITETREGKIALSRVFQALRAFTGRGGMSDR